jgi:membrane protein DedA with SNARE-associated domain
VFFSRMIPIVRTFISLPAGMGRMPFWKFTVYTALGCIPWVILLTWVGVRLGDNWEAIRGWLHYADYVVAAAIVIVVAWLVVRRRRRRPEGASATGPGRGEEA